VILTQRIYMPNAAMTAEISEVVAGDFNSKGFLLCTV